jgi:ubiquinone/menaquinone biosynthesis C-methylase UbiE
MTKVKKDTYIPALSFRWLTPYFDMIQKWIVRDLRYKTLLLERASIKSNDRVLDLGCGSGTLAIMAKRSVPSAEVIGLDADDEILSMARQKAQQENMAVRFDIGMTFKLPYPDSSFDRVLSSIMIHHLKTADKERTAREIFRVLKPGGQMHILDFGKPVTFYGKLLRGFLHGFEEANDNIDGRLPEIFSAPGLKVKETGVFPTFFGDLIFLGGEKPV